jgi:2-polyprenyl-3-methyl-5-hydroxy-6-metoxy-1,4-benzoquinol methylase
MKQWYEDLFDDYAQQYDREVFTQGTMGECDFIEQEIGHNKRCRILDIGCGTGRHSLELARRGYSVTGIDLSESQLQRARKKAGKEKLAVRFLKCDARNLSFKAKFDLAIMICEGAFPLMETDEMNYRILQGAAKALKRNGRLIFTTLNGLFPLFHSVKDFLSSKEKEGDDRFGKITFDLMTFRDHSVTTVVSDSGVSKELHCNERYYVPSEISWLLKSLKFKTIEIFGAKNGQFSRSHALTAEDFEMLVVARK